MTSHAMDNEDIRTLFLSFARKRLMEDYWPRMQACVSSLTEDQLWWRPNDASNSVGNLLLHLDGNLNQWIVSAFDRTADSRNRPAEFSERGGPSREVLLDRLGTTLRRVDGILARLTEEDLRRTYAIQGDTVNGLHAVFRVTEHFALHYGQVAYITKSLAGRDLGFT